MDQVSRDFSILLAFSGAENKPNKKMSHSDHDGFEYLSVKGDSTGLALGADALRPGQMALTAGLDFTADVLKCCKLAPEKRLKMQ